MSRWILVVEDEGTLGAMVRDNLEMDGYEVEWLRDGAEALERLERGGIDLVVLDIMLPGMQGTEVLARMRSRGDHTPVLILSARGSEDDRVRGLELGADDYLPKPFNLRELLLRVGSLLRRAQPVPAGDDVLRFGGNEIDCRALTAVDWRGDSQRITATELRLLRMLFVRQGEVVSRAELVRDLFGPATPPSARTLDNLAARLRRMFERDSRQPRHLHTVRGVGLRFTPEPE